MENASKALLLSASVLIAIILIAVGIRILGTVKPTVDQVGKVSTSLEVSIFNSQFAKYEGTQKGNAVRSLLRLLQQISIKEKNINIHIDFLGEQDETLNASQEVFAQFIGDTEISKTYNVTISIDQNTGYINSVTIVED